MKKIIIGIIGAGRATQLHMNAYKKVHGAILVYESIYDIDIKKSSNAASLYGINNVANTVDQIFNNPKIDVIDICTPPFTHKDYIIRALRSNKHVICEKPLCGFFENGNTDKKKMYNSVLKDINDIEKALLNTSKKFFYAENFIYAPSIQKAAELIKCKKSKILFAKGEESLAGSSSAVAGLWNKTGGGSLIRVGCHPLAAILWLKKNCDSTIEISKVVADIDIITDKLNTYEHRHIMANPLDVEDHAIVSLTFTDQTKALIIACDSRLGGSKNYIELYCNDAMIECNLTMNNCMSTYLLDEDGLENYEISEMLKTKCGWNNPFVADEIMRGYVGEMQDFINCILEDLEPLSNFTIAKETIKTIYLAYANSNNN